MVLKVEQKVRLESEEEDGVGGNVELFCCNLTGSGDWLLLLLLLMILLVLLLLAVEKTLDEVPREIDRVDRHTAIAVI